jgi:hypothetical protein
MKTEVPIEFSDVKQGMDIAIKQLRGGSRVRHCGRVAKIDHGYVTLDKGGNILLMVNLDVDQSGTPTVDFFEVVDE